MSLFAQSSKLTARTINSSLRTTFTRNNFARNFHSTLNNMVVHNLSNKSEFQTALKEHDIVVLDCFATWCGPCKAIAPQIVKFSDHFTGAHFAKLDVDEVPDVAGELGIRAMPTFLIFKGEDKVAEVVGANPKAIEAAIEKVIKGE